MDDIRIGSVSPYDPHRGQDGSASKKRTKRTPAQEQAGGEDDVALSSSEDETGGEPVEDYYSPSKSNDEPK